MVASVLRGVDVLFGPHLALWASDVHAIGLSFLGIAWIWPWLAKVFRWRAHAPEIEWVRLWRCPQCNTFNRRTFAACSHCDYKLREGGWKDWIPSSISEKMKRSGGQILSLYKACGWMVFYGLTGLAFWALRFYSFRQDPLQELLASVTVALLLLSLLFFHRAFRPALKCPIGGLMDLAAGLGVFGFVFFFALCWAAAFFPPNKPLAYLQPLASGQIDLKNPAGLQARITGTRLGRSLQFQVQYAVLSWPFFDIRQVFVTRVSGKALMPPWFVFLGDRIAPQLQKEGVYRPRLVLLNQTLEAAAGATYALTEPKPGLGLALRKGA